MLSSVDQSIASSIPSLLYFECTFDENQILSFVHLRRQFYSEIILVIESKDKKRRLKRFRSHRSLVSQSEDVDCIHLQLSPRIDSHDQYFSVCVGSRRKEDTVDIRHVRPRVVLDSFFSIPSRCTYDRVEELGWWSVLKVDVQSVSFETVASIFSSSGIDRR